MKKIFMYFVVMTVCFLGSTLAVMAQEMAAKKFDNPQWKQVVLIKFKSGAVDRAKQIIKDYYAKASQKAGTADPEVFIELRTGEWDMLVIWGMKGGVDDLNWEISPDDAKWMKAMNEIAGSAEKSKAIMDEFSSLVVRETNYLGKSGMPAM